MRERQLYVHVRRRDGTVFAQPVGTFKGLGALAGINPVRRASSDVSDAVLGRMIVDLLARSGPTGYHVRQVREYMAATKDRATIEARREMGLDGLGEAKIARRYAILTIAQRRGQKSWTVTLSHYDSGMRAHRDDQSLRVKLAEGEAALGSTIRTLSRDAARRPRRASALGVSIRERSVRGRE